MRPSVPALVGLLALGLVGCRTRTLQPSPVPPVSLTLVAVGDILPHQDVQLAAAQDPGGFPALWPDLIPVFQGADLAFGNMESPIAPASGRPPVPFQFNAPGTLPAALRASGFSVLSTANNHAFDQGGQGVRETLQRLSAEGLVAIGSGEDRLRTELPRILERRGLRVAFLGFTDLFNEDLNREATHPWVRPLELAAAGQAVREARGQAELVVISVHWGEEYQHLPSRRQREAAYALVEAGADVILGHHPHVLQPIEYLEAGGHKGLVAYSLGNFISNQDRMYRPDRDPVAEGDNRDGVALRLRFERRGNPGAERLVLAEATAEPLWTENNWGLPAARRVIRVVRVAAAEAQVRTDLEAMAAPLAGPGSEADEVLRRKLLSEKQEYLRTLALRKRRIAEVVGEAFVR